MGTMHFIGIKIVCILQLIQLTKSVDLSPVRCVRVMPLVATPVEMKFLPSIIQCALYCQNYLRTSAYSFEGNTCKLYNILISNSTAGIYCEDNLSLKGYYCLVQQKKSQNDSLQFCRDNNMGLLSVETKAECEFAFDFFRTHRTGSDLLAWSSGLYEQLVGYSRYFWLTTDASLTNVCWASGRPSQFNANYGMAISLLANMSYKPTPQKNMDNMPHVNSYPFICEVQ